MKSRKAISPVIATLLLILIAVAASILVYVWVTGYASSVTGTEATQLQERIKIDAVSPNATNGYRSAMVYVRNIGDIQVNVSTVYIINQTTGEILGINSTGKVLSPGDVYGFNVTLSAPLKAGINYLAKAVTANGIEATYVFRIRR